MISYKCIEREGLRPLQRLPLRLCGLILAPQTRRSDLSVLLNVLQRLALAQKRKLVFIILILYSLKKFQQVFIFAKQCDPEVFS